LLGGKRKHEATIVEYPIKQEIAKADRSINEQDFDRVASFYTEDAGFIWCRAIKNGFIKLQNNRLKVF